jgi:hypothetical protein
MSSVPSAARSKQLKLALIPVLALTLGYVLFWPAKNDADAMPAARTKQPLPEIPLKSAATTAPHKDPPFDEVQLADVLAYNPFADAVAKVTPPTIAGAPQDPSSSSAPGNSDSHNGDDNTQTSAKRTVRHVSAVVELNGRACAFLDGEFVAEGDTLADGSRVVSITAERVTIEAE